MNIPVKTPAQTARQDLSRYSPNKNKGNRHKDIEKRAKELFNQAVATEQLREKYNDPKQRAAVMQRVQELLKSTRIQAQQQIPPVTISREQQRLYSRARLLLGIENKWNSGGKDQYEHACEKSVTEVTQRAEGLRAAANWLELCKPTIASYTNEVGKDSFDSFDVVVKEYESGLVTTQKQSELYSSIIKGFDLFTSRWASRASAFEDELAKHEDDPIGDLKTCIEDHFELERVYEDIEDGCLWYYNPRTECLHFFNLCWGIEVDMAFNGILPKYADTWEQAWATDLRNVIDMVSVSAKYPAEQDCRSYFAVWNSIRPWVKKAVDAGNVIPTGFPSNYVEKNINT